MIDLDNYNLDTAEIKSLRSFLDKVGPNPRLQDIWKLMDEAWHECGCNNRQYDFSSYSEFYSHPVWLLNGIFIEHHQESIDHRIAMTKAIKTFNPTRVVDYGGGFGTLARLLSQAMPNADIHVCEPFPPRHGIECCSKYKNIAFVSELRTNYYDVLVSTDVLEHVEDPIKLLSLMVDSVLVGGHLIIANCFYPVIECHLPATFHLRYSFDLFCGSLGLEKIAPCEGAWHGIIYRRVNIVKPNWSKLRKMEQMSRIKFPWRVFREKKLTIFADMLSSFSKFN